MPTDMKPDTNPITMPPPLQASKVPLLEYAPRPKDIFHYYQLLGCHALSLYESRNQQVDLWKCVKG